MASEYMDIEETAEYIGNAMSVAALRWHRHMATGPRSFKLGRRVVYRRADIDAWIQAQHAKGVGMAADDESRTSA